MDDARRLPALTGLRGLAALWVLVFHAWALAGSAGADAAAPLAAVLGAGWLGVDVFFVLSGFLLARSVQTEGGGLRPGVWRAYALMRAARILPAYYAQLLVLGLLAFVPTLGAALAWSPEGIGEWLAHGVLWFNAWPWVPAHLGPWWSLPVEAGFYIALPSLWLWLEGSARRWAAALLLAAVLAVVWRMAVQALAPGVEERIGWAEHLPGRGVQFVAGVVLARMLQGRPPLRGPQWRGTLIACAALLALVLLPFIGGERPYRGLVDARWWTWCWPVLTSLPVAALLWALVRFPQAGFARLLASAPLRAIGLVSFSLYLWHYPVQWALRSALGGYVPAEWGLAGFMATSLVLSLALATLSWGLVERPALNAARRWRDRLLAPLWSAS